MSEPHRSRRGFLAALGGAAALSTSGTATASPSVGTSSSSAGTTPLTVGTARSKPAGERTATLHVRVYPGPTPESVRTVHGWSRVHLEASYAVLEALRTLAVYTRTTTDLDRVYPRLEPMAPVDLPLGRPPFEEVAERFREAVREREADTGECCHLLLWWEPLNHDVGYGGTRLETSRVARRSDEGGHTVANVGATERWDSRAVTRNIAIHEVLHTFVSPDVVEEVIDSRCDHDLGSAVRSGKRLTVSPLATAYAGPERVGGGTQFHGTGCYDHDSFHRHDGYEGVEEFVYTSRLSEAALEAVSIYVDRYLGD